MPPHTIKGTLERIIFQSEETYFTVAKLQEEGKQDHTIIVGSLLRVNPGETLELMSIADFGMRISDFNYLKANPGLCSDGAQSLGQRVPLCGHSHASCPLPHVTAESSLHWNHQGKGAPCDRGDEEGPGNGGEE